VSRRLYPGPMHATWCIEWADRRGGSTSVYHPDQVRVVVREQQAADPGRPVLVTRHERCPAPGCDAHGVRSVRGARGMWKQVECVDCRGRHDVVEDLATLEPAVVTVPGEAALRLVLGRCGLTLSEPLPPLYDGDDVVRWRVLHTGWELCQGRERTLWLWLYETGRIMEPPPAQLARALAA
jgi:hypothetical protein